MAAQNSLESPKKKRTRKTSKHSGHFKPLAQLSKEHGMVCDTVLTLRLPKDLKEKLTQRENWRDELRQILLNLVESDTQHSLS